MSPQVLLCRQPGASPALQAAGYVTDTSTCSLHEETFELHDGNITTDDAVRLPCAGVLLQPSITHECDFERHDHFFKEFCEHITWTLLPR